MSYSEESGCGAMAMHPAQVLSMQASKLTLKIQVDSEYSRCHHFTEEKAEVLESWGVRYVDATAQLQSSCE